MSSLLDTVEIHTGRYSGAVIVHAVPYDGIVTGGESLSGYFTHFLSHDIVDDEVCKAPGVEVKFDGCSIVERIGVISMKDNLVRSYICTGVGPVV